MNQTSSGILGALITTYVTFLPCFLFIFIGARTSKCCAVIKRSRSVVGVTAAVVAVDLESRLVFGLAVIWPQEWAAARTGSRPYSVS